MHVMATWPGLVGTRGAGATWPGLVGTRGAGLGLGRTSDFSSSIIGKPIVFGTISQIETGSAYCIILQPRQSPRCSTMDTGSHPAAPPDAVHLR